MSLINHGLKRVYSTTRLTARVIASAALAISQLASGVQGAEPAAKSATADPIVVTRIPSIARIYDDLKLVFELAHDADGFKTFKETLDEFLVGVDTAQPCQIQTFVTSDGLSTVISAPVKDQAAFQKFLENLWDLDVKTSPPPSAQKARQIPAAVQKKLQAHKLQTNERIMFGLTDGALRFDSGHVYLGKSVNDVRLSHFGKQQAEKSASLTIEILGDSAIPAQRHEAFQKSRKELLSLPKREDFESQAEFDLAQAFADYELAKLELLVADSAQVRAAYTLAHEKKNSRFEAEVTPVRSTALAKDVEGIGQKPDLFAGVSEQNTVASINIDLPIGPTLGKLLKSVADHAHTVANEKIDRSSQINADQIQTRKDVADLILDVANDVAGMEVFNACLRTWTDSEGKLTTVGATHISHPESIRERIQKFRHREPVTQARNSGPGNGIVKIVHAQWKQDAPELFDSEGSVYLAVTDQALWYAMGPKALDRLDLAMQAPAKGTERDKNSAIEIHAQMQPLAHVWNAVRSRSAPKQKKSKTDSSVSAKDASKTAKTETPKAGGNTGASHEMTSNRTRLADAKSSVSDLELHKVASEAFQKGDGHFSLSLKREGDKAKLLVTCDEGILRFVGLTLSKFTKDNLADN